MDHNNDPIFIPDATGGTEGAGGATESSVSALLVVLVMIAAAIYWTGNSEHFPWRSLLADARGVIEAGAVVIGAYAAFAVRRQHLEGGVRTRHARLATAAVIIGLLLVSFAVPPILINRLLAT